MASKKDMGNPIPYSYKRPLDFGDLTESLFNRAALSDTRPKDKKEDKKKRRDDE
jgi:hypothetical protein